MHRLLGIFLLILPLYAGCMTAGGVTDIDISTTGFIDDNTFQVIITSPPDENTTGLVPERESSIIRARNKMESDVIIHIKSYIVNYCNETNRKDIASVIGENTDIEKNLREYLAVGGIFTEYFDKNNNAVIAYRIKKNGLKNEFNRIPLQIISQKEPVK
jgi:hypothetical protein